MKFESLTVEYSRFEDLSTRAEIDEKQSRNSLSAEEMRNYVNWVYGWFSISRGKTSDVAWVKSHFRWENIWYFPCRVLSRN